MRRDQMVSGYQNKDIIPGWERESPIGSVTGSLLVNFNNLHDICLYV